MLTLDTLTDLEQRIEKLIVAFQGSNRDRDMLKQQLEGKDRLIEELESSKKEMEIQIESLRASLEDRQTKLTEAAERIQDILKKFETVGG